MGCWLFVIAISIISVATAADDNLVTEEPSDKFLAKGSAKDTLLLPCLLTTDKTKYTKVEWLHNTAAICDATTPGDPGTCKDPEGNNYKLHTTDHYTLLAAKEVDFSFGGKYNCKVTIPNKNPYAALDKEAELTIVDEAESCTADVTMKPKQTKTLSCTVKYKGNNKPKAMLKIEGEDTNIPGTAGVDGTPDSDGAIPYTISADITAGAGGVTKYVCGITDGASTPCNIQVTVEGSVNKKPQDTAGVVGKTAELLCTMKASSTYTSAVWKREVVGASASAIETICTGYKDETTTKSKCEDSVKDVYDIDTPAKHDLKVKDVTDSIAGKYTCDVDDGEVYPAELVVIKSAPTCSEKDGDVTCVVLYKGNKQPSVHWYKGDDKIPGSDPTEGTGDDGWSTSTLITKVDDTEKKYMCKVLNSAEESITDCVGHNAADGLQAKLYQSTLMSAFVLWLWYSMV